MRQQQPYKCLVLIECRLARTLIQAREARTNLFFFALFRQSSQTILRIVGFTSKTLYLFNL